MVTPVPWRQHHQAMRLRSAYPEKRYPIPGTEWM
jgi:hypothetical protein